MSRRLLTALALAAAALALAAPAGGAAEPQTSLSEISSEVMCPVCGTLLELAESPQAQREKVFVKRLVDAGKSKQQIKDALVAEYGDAVLALPQGSGFSLSAYVVPIVAFAIAAVALAFGVAALAPGRRRPRRRQQRLGAASRRAERRRQRAARRRPRPLRPLNDDGAQRRRPEPPQPRAQLAPAAPASLLGGDSRQHRVGLAAASAGACSSSGGPARTTRS